MDVFIIIYTLIAKYFNLFKLGYYPTSESVIDPDTTFTTTDKTTTTYYLAANNL